MLLIFIHFIVIFFSPLDQLGGTAPTPEACLIYMGRVDFACTTCWPLARLCVVVDTATQKLSGIGTWAMVNVKGFLETSSGWMGQHLATFNLNQFTQRIWSRISNATLPMRRMLPPPLGRQ